MGFSWQFISRNRKMKQRKLAPAGVGDEAPKQRVQDWSLASLTRDSRTPLKNRISTDGDQTQNAAAARPRRGQLRGECQPRCIERRGLPPGQHIIDTGRRPKPRSRLCSVPISDVRTRHPPVHRGTEPRVSASPARSDPGHVPGLERSHCSCRSFSPPSRSTPITIFAVQRGCGYSRVVRAADVRGGCDEAVSRALPTATSHAAEKLSYVGDMETL